MLDIRDMFWFFRSLCWLFCPSLKGVLIMAILPVTTCAQMLGIHPKTFHRWLTQADFPFAAHPTDARIKCVAEEHFLEVARQHERPLQPSAPSLVFSGAALPVSSQEQVSLTPENQAASFQADLIQKLSCLETKVATLQEQLAHLALALLQEREISVERRLSTLEATTTGLLGQLGFSPSLAESPSPGTEPGRGSVMHVPRLLNLAEHRARSRMPPLIEYSAQGEYVIVSSQDGELHLAPDSTEWFDWLATLSSFRFIGKQGSRFTAYRESDHRGPTRGWTAHRSVHRRRCKHYLGVTDRLSITSLEQGATLIQAQIDVL